MNKLLTPIFILCAFGFFLAMSSLLAMIGKSYHH